MSESEGYKRFKKRQISEKDAISKLGDHFNLWQMLREKGYKIKDEGLDNKKNN